jgi:hypothetical protein
MKFKRPLYCAADPCHAEATFLVEGTSYCDKHLVETVFKSTNLEIEFIGGKR